MILFAGVCDMETDAKVHYLPIVQLSLHLHETSNQYLFVRLFSLETHSNTDENNILHCCR